MKQPILPTDKYCVLTTCVFYSLLSLSTFSIYRNRKHDRHNYNMYNNVRSRKHTRLLSAVRRLMKRPIKKIAKNGVSYT